jgi:hypothetical protein
MRSLAVALVFGGFCFAAPSAHAVCSWTTLTNGTTANATQVMNNFDCLAPLASPSFTGYVGIGTTSAGAPIDIRGSLPEIRFTATGTGGGTLRFYSSDTSERGVIRFDSSKNFQIETAGSEKLRITASGNVGIGTASPTAALSFVDVSASDSPVGITWYNPNPTAYGIYRTAGGWTSPDYQQLKVSFPTGIILDGGYTYGRSGTSIQPDGGATSIGSLTAPSGVKLYVRGDSGSATNGIIVLTRADLGGSNSNILHGSNGDWFIRSSLSSGKVILQDTGGNVGIGTGSPAQKLDVSGTIRQTNCTANIALHANSSGDIICNPSDARLKDIYGRYAGGLREIGRITPVRFRYKPTRDGVAPDFEHAGFVAQELKGIIPQAVARQANGYYAIDTTAILAASVNAIKELEARNKRQVAENASQASQIVRLQARLDAIERRLATQAAHIASGAPK